MDEPIELAFFKREDPTDIASPNEHSILFFFILSFQLYWLSLSLIRALVKDLEWLRSVSALIGQFSVM